MCWIDKKELDRIVGTYDSSQELAQMANKIIRRLCEEGYEPEFINKRLEWEETPYLVFYKKERL